MTPNAAAGEHQTITVNNTSAMTINAPTNPPASGEGQNLTIEIFNSSGGTMGAVSWGAAFKGISTIPNPPNGQRMMLWFRWNGTNWVLVSGSSGGQTLY